MEATAAALLAAAAAAVAASLLGPLALRLIRLAREEVSAAAKLAAAPGSAQVVRLGVLAANRIAVFGAVLPARHSERVVVSGVATNSGRAAAQAFSARWGLPAASEVSSGSSRGPGSPRARAC
jgi:hypothetical protein